MQPAEIATNSPYPDAIAIRENSVKIAFCALSVKKQNSMTLGA
jgi:hypothetical protein